MQIGVTCREIIHLDTADVVVRKPEIRADSSVAAMGIPPLRDTNEAAASNLVCGHNKKWSAAASMPQPRRATLKRTVSVLQSTALASNSSGARPVRPERQRRYLLSCRQGTCASSVTVLPSHAQSFRQKARPPHREGLNRHRLTLSWDNRDGVQPGGLRLVHLAYDLGIAPEQHFAFLLPQQDLPMLRAEARAGDNQLSTNRALRRCNVRDAGICRRQKG